MLTEEEIWGEPEETPLQVLMRQAKRPIEFYWLEDEYFPLPEEILVMYEGGPEVIREAPPLAVFAGVL
jgi:hypothetical protein